MTFTVRHIDEFGGVSADATDTETTGTNGTAPAMTYLTAEKAILDTAFVITDFVPTVVRLTARPTNRAYDVAFERAPDDTGAPDTGAIVRIARVSGVIHDTPRRLGDPLEVGYDDFRPVDGATWWYRAVHVRNGWTDGTATDWVAITMEDWDNAPLVEHRVVREDVVTTDVLLIGDAGEYVDENSTIFVGTEDTPATLLKTTTIPCHAFQIKDSSMGFVYTINYVSPAVTDSTIILFASLTLPPGSTITGFTADLYKETGGDIAECELFRMDGPTSSTSLGFVEFIGTLGTWQSESDGVDEDVQPVPYVIQVNLAADVVSPDARFSSVTIGYTVPDYAKSI